MIRLALAFVTFLSLAHPLHAEPAYPQTTIRIVLGFSPEAHPTWRRASSLSVSGRHGESRSWSRTCWSGGNLAADHVAKAAPDGATLLMAGNAAIVINPSLYAKLPYDPARDLAPIAQVTIAPNVLVSNKDVPARSVQDLVELARRRPGELTFASAGIGTSTHLAGELFQTMAGVKLQHVPYRDSATLSSDLVTGRVTMFFGSIASVLPQAQMANCAHWRSRRCGAHRRCRSCRPSTSSASVDSMPAHGSG